MPNKRVTQQISDKIEQALDEIRELEKKLTQVEVEVNQKELGDVKIEIVSDFLKHFSEMFHALGDGEKRLLIQSVVKNIVVHNKKG